MKRDMTITAAIRRLIDQFEARGLEAPRLIELARHEDGLRLLAEVEPLLTSPVSAARASAISRAEIAGIVVTWPPSIDHYREQIANAPGTKFDK